jgi:dCMP deaminase
VVAVARPSIDVTLLDIAKVMAERGTCPYIQVGAVIVRDGRILSSGYNGAPAGMKHCTHGALRDLSNVTPCTTAIHAESNAIAYAARHGTALRDATLYTTLTPCRTCAQLVIQAGIVRVVAGEWYRDRTGVDLLRDGFVAVSVVGWGMDA